MTDELATLNQIASKLEILVTITEQIRDLLREAQDKRDVSVEWHHDR